MKTSAIGKTSKSVAAAMLIVAAFLFVAGCGGSGGPAAYKASVSTASTGGTESTSTDKEVYYDLDIESDGRTAGRAALDTVSTPTADILALKSRVESLPNSAFVKTSKKQIAMGELKRRRLARIVDFVVMDVKHNRYSRAAMVVDRKLIPRLDGCNGGKTKDDYILDCTSKATAYKSAVEIETLLASYTAPNPGGRHTHRAAAASIDTFRTSVLAKISTLKTYINALPNSAFSGVVSDPRTVLVDILTIAANEALDGDFDAAKSEISDNFIPYVDGLNGDDLITDATAKADVYSSATAIVAELSVTAVSVSPSTGARLSIGDTYAFSADCTYSDQYTEDCTDRVTWTSSATAVGTIDSVGIFTAVAAGTADVSAAYGTIASAAAPVVVDSPYLIDNFDTGYMDAEKWNDFTNTGTISYGGGVVMMEGPKNQYSEIATAHYFNVDAGEAVSFEVDIDLGSSYGEYYVGGFGITDNMFEGIAVGLAGGTSVNGTMAYYSSPLRGSGGTFDVGNVRSGKFRVEYQNGIANVYLNGVLKQSFEAELDGKRLSFFVFSTAGWGSSYYSMSFDNFATNQPYPGDAYIKIENMTNPFGVDGSGTFANQESFKITVVDTPGLTNVQAGIVDPNDLSNIVAPAVMAETSSGVYELTGTLPMLSSTQLAAVASDDDFAAIALHTRRIDVAGASASRSAARQAADGHFLLNIFPAAILPGEIGD